MAPIHSLSYMKKIYLELTNRCNLNCVMCYRNSWETPLDDMTKETLDKIATGLNKDVGIVFGGIGEPSVAKQFEYAVRLFKDHRLEITTNGVLSKRNLDMICQHFDNIIVSVDGTEETYFHIRKTDFKQVINTLEFIKNYKKNNRLRTPQIEFAFVLSKNNKDSLFSVIDLASQYDVKRVLVSHLLPQNDAQTKAIYYDEHFNAEGRKFAAEVSNYAYFKNRVVVSFPYMEIKTERLCHFIENDYTYIDFKGDVVPCYRLASTYKEYVFGRKKQVKKHTFGNVNTQSIQDIYHSEVYQCFRHAVHYSLHPSCVDCEFRDGCDFIETSEYDCSGYSPSCADCLWNRRIIRCT